MHLPRSRPEEQSIDSRGLLALIDAAESRSIELHSLMVLRHGHVVAEGWWDPYDRDGVQLLYSLSKSFTSTAVGLAVADGLLSVDDRVTGFFPELLDPEPARRWSELTVRHLLTMTTGHANDTIDRMIAGSSDDWVREFLAIPPQYRPGEHFHYNNGATYVLAAIVQQLSASTLLDYLRPRLLDPLGIGAARWQEAPSGVHLGFSGLHVTTESIARFGQLLLRRGVTPTGRRILTDTWVEQATSAEVSTAARAEIDWSLGYGFQFWRSQHDSYRADGGFGQFCLVLPQQDAVIVTTAATEDMQLLLDVVWDHLLPAMHPEPLDASDDHDELVERMGGLRLETVAGSSSPGRGAELVGRRLRPSRPVPFAPIERVQIEPDGDAWMLDLWTDRGPQRVRCGLHEWRRGSIVFAPFGHQPVAGSAAWDTRGAFTAELVFVESPHRLRITCSADAQGAGFEMTWNVVPMW